MPWSFVVENRMPWSFVVENRMPWSFVVENIMPWSFVVENRMRPWSFIVENRMPWSFVVENRMPWSFVVENRMPWSFVVVIFCLQPIHVIMIAFDTTSKKSFTTLYVLKLNLQVVTTCQCMVSRYVLGSRGFYGRYTEKRGRAMTAHSGPVRYSQFQKD